MISPFRGWFAPTGIATVGVLWLACSKHTPAPSPSPAPIDADTASPADAEAAAVAAIDQAA